MHLSKKLSGAEKKWGHVIILTICISTASSLERVEDDIRAIL